MEKTKNIGIDVPTPEKKCSDKHCPFHGTLKLRGRIFIGEVISAKAHKTATIRWTRLFYIPKYERYEKRLTRIRAHNPECIDVNEGDKVKIVECKPISKTKHFVVVQRL